MELDDSSNPKFLEQSLAEEILQKIEQINKKCHGKIGEDIVEDRIRQVAYAKIITKIFKKNISYLIKAYTELGIAYYDIKYVQQAREHLLNAFKLNEEADTDSDDNEMKKFQIKILINYAKSCIEEDKHQKRTNFQKEKEKMEEENYQLVITAQQVCERCKRMNQTLYGKDHESNADIYYVLAKIHTKLGELDTAIECLNEVYAIYEKAYGTTSEKIAKIEMEKGQIFVIKECYFDAIESYQHSLDIWKEIKDENKYSYIFQLAQAISNCYLKYGEEFTGEKRQQYFELAYSFLDEIEENYSSSYERPMRDKIAYQAQKAEVSERLEDFDCTVSEYQKLIDLYKEYGQKKKDLANTYISLGNFYFYRRKDDAWKKYYDKAQEIFTNHNDQESLNNLMNLRNRNFNILEKEITQKNEKSTKEEEKAYR